MLAAIKHRGPDGQEVHVDKNIAMGAVRLAMVESGTDEVLLKNREKTIFLAYNGEIYNYKSLRASLSQGGYHMIFSTEEMKDLSALYPKNISGYEGFDKVGGFSSDNYRLENAGKRYLLKIYKEKDPAEIRTIEEVTFALAEGGVSVAPPIQSSSGEYSARIGAKKVSLYPWVDGVVLHEDAFTEATLDASADALSNLHSCAIPKEISLPHSSRTLISKEEFYARAKSVYQLINERPHGEEIDNTARKLLKLKADLIDHVVRVDNFGFFLNQNHLVHGDFHNENLLFSADGKVLAILDFEAVHRGHKMEDVVNFIMFACCNTGFKEKNIDLAKRFLAGYRGRSPFSRDELSFGVHYTLFRLLSSVFLEEILYKDREPFFAQLLERDLKKFYFFKDDLEAFISSLMGEA